MLNGTGNCIGYGIGRAKIREDSVLDIKKIKVEHPEKELARFDAAYEELRRIIQALLDREIADTGDAGEKIFETHLAFLEDPGFVDAIRETIKTESVNAEWAVREVGERLSQTLLQVESELIRERSADIRDLYSNLLRILSGRKVGGSDAPVLNAAGRSVLVMEELVPSFVIQLEKGKVAALVAEKGNITSHAVILAKLKSIPTVVGIGGLMEAVSEGDLLTVDSFAGEVRVDPDTEALAAITRASERYEAELCACNAEISADSVTIDGTHIAIEANIGTPAEAELANDACAEGIGLFRSEFLFMERETLPGEEEQFCAYRQAARSMGCREVVIRTMDIGGDKHVPGLRLPAEQNPFLGLRAIRLSLQRKDLFRIQLRAILRASAEGEVAIMFPMISSMEELQEAKAMVEEAKASLDASGSAYSKTIRIGIMVEVPAAVILSDLFAQEVDFFSIGTNDLIQYTLAADRLNQAVAPLYTPYHPAVLRQIALVAQNGRKHGIETAICGEAASDPLLQPLFVGFGVDRLSMIPSLIPMTKRTIRRCRETDCRELAQRVLTLPSAALVKKELLAFQQEQRSRTTDGGERGEAL